MLCKENNFGLNWNFFEIERKDSKEKGIFFQFKDYFSFKMTSHITRKKVSSLQDKKEINIGILATAFLTSADDCIK